MGAPRRKHCALDNDTPPKLVCLPRSSFGVVIAPSVFLRQRDAPPQKKCPS